MKAATTLQAVLLRMQLPSGARTTPGFTLIELVVVVAILMVLLALLMAVAPMAMERARSVQCLSNLRQQGMAVAAYTDDNHGRIMPVYSAWNPVSRTTYAGDYIWNQWLVPYIATQHEGHHHQGRFNESILGVLTCPTWAFRSPQRWSWDNVVWHKVGYGMNYELNRPINKHGPLFYWWMATPMQRNFHLSNISFPSQRILLGDSVDWHCSVDRFHDGAPRWHNASNTFWSPGMDNFKFRSGEPNRHGRDRANYLYCDLSVRPTSGQDAAWAIYDPSRAP